MNFQSPIRIFFFTALMICALTTLASAQATPLAIGQPAPDFSLKDLKGKTHSLKDYRGQTVIVAFFSTQCPIVNAYHERIRSLVNDYEKRGVTLLALYPNYNESRDAIKRATASQKPNFPVFRDDDNQVADLFAAKSTPEMFILDAAGVLRYRGRIDNSPEASRLKRHDLREALDELLAGKAITNAETKAFGCAIKRAKSGAFSKTQTANSGFAASLVTLLKPAEFAKLKEESKGRVLVLNFWATWCAPCVAEFPEFVTLDQKYRDKGVRVVAISIDEISDLKTKVIPFVQKQKARFEIFVQDADDPQPIIDQVDKQWSGALPSTFIFDRQGKLVWSVYGIIERDKITAALDEALKK